MSDHGSPCVDAWRASRGGRTQGSIGRSKRDLYDRVAEASVAADPRGFEGVAGVAQRLLRIDVEDPGEPHAGEEELSDGIRKVVGCGAPAAPDGGHDRIARGGQGLLVERA